MDAVFHLWGQDMAWPRISCHTPRYYLFSNHALLCGGAIRVALWWRSRKLLRSFQHISTGPNFYSGFLRIWNELQIKGFVSSKSRSGDSMSAKKTIPLFFLHFHSPSKGSPISYHWSPQLHIFSLFPFDFISWWCHHTTACYPPSKLPAHLFGHLIAVSDSLASLFIQTIGLCFVFNCLIVLFPLQCFSLKVILTLGTPCPLFSMRSRTSPSHMVKKRSSTAEQPVAVMVQPCLMSHGQRTATMWNKTRPFLFPATGYFMWRIAHMRLQGEFFGASPHLETRASWEWKEGFTSLVRRIRFNSFSCQLTQWAFFEGLLIPGLSAFLYVSYRSRVAKCSDFCVC